MLPSVLSQFSSNLMCVSVGINRRPLCQANATQEKGYKFLHRSTRTNDVGGSESRTDRGEVTGASDRRASTRRTSLEDPEQSLTSRGHDRIGAAPPECTPPTGHPRISHIGPARSGAGRAWVCARLSVTVGVRPVSQRVVIEMRRLANYSGS